MRYIALAVGVSLYGCSVQAATTYTGDKVQGMPVISALEIADLAVGQHRFMFEGVEMGSGQRWYVPIMITKGKQPGKKVLLQAGVHGDELNGVKIVQQAMAQLDPQMMRGSVMAIIGPNRSGVERIARTWSVANGGGDIIDYNRVHPGKEYGNGPERQAWLLWNKVYEGNIDIAIDYHTASTGGSFPLFIYADYRNDDVKQMAELFPADQIKKDPGEIGSVETTFVTKGIPAITAEVGGPRAYQHDIIERGLQGTMNVLIHYKVIEGEIQHTAQHQQTYIGNQMTRIRAKTGGFADILVKIGDDVKEGDLVARQRNAFGDVVAEYTVTSSGKVLSIATDVLSEPRTTLVTILSQSKEERCQFGC